VAATVAVGLAALALEVVEPELAAAATPPPGSLVVSLPPTVATFVDQFVPSSILWGSPQLLIGRDSAGETNTLLKFDVSTIPIGSNIARAELKMTSTSRTGTVAPNTMVVSRATSNWTSATTWNSRPTSAESIATTIGTSDVTLINRYVDQWVNDGLPNRGVVARPTGDVTGYTNGYSDETAATSSERPVLVVTYTPPDPSTLTVASEPVSGLLDGSCGFSEITQSRYFATRPGVVASTLTTGQVSIGQDGTSLSVCVTGVAGDNSGWDTQWLGVSTGDSHSVPDGRDVRFEATPSLAPVVRVGNGAGGWNVTNLPGWTTSTQRTFVTAAEFRIPLSSLGWSCGPLSLRFMGAVVDIDAGGDNRAWPSTSSINNPGLWHPVALTGLPACASTPPTPPTIPTGGSTPGAAGPGSATPAPQLTSAQWAALVAFVNALRFAQFVELVRKSQPSRCRSVRRAGRVVRVCAPVRSARR